MAKTTGYYGDVEVTVKYRYRLSGEFKKVGKDKRPSKADVLKMLKSCQADDITDIEELQVLSVEKVGENCDGEFSDTEEEMTPEGDHPGDYLT